MFLNDAFDAPFDERVRPERPIPRGDVSRPEVLIAGGGLLALGESLLRPNRSAMILGGILAAAIVFYNYRHKGSTLAPLVMGACRGLVYLIAATVVGAGVRGSVGGGVGGVGGGVVSGVALGGAGAIALYVVGLTVVAKRAGASARWLVPVLIAGISLVDAAFILVVSPSRAPLAVVAAMGFPLTLFLQRWVPGD
jgi:4-hydroxybenzoate polyprenyltransferase